MNSNSIIHNFFDLKTVQVPVPIFRAADVHFNDSDDEYILDVRYLGRLRPVVQNALLAC